jgi:hypothetical protein
VSTKVPSCYGVSLCTEPGFEVGIAVAPYTHTPLPPNPCPRARARRGASPPPLAPHSSTPVTGALICCTLGGDFPLVQCLAICGSSPLVDVCVSYGSRTFSLSTAASVPDVAWGL